MLLTKQQTQPVEKTATSSTPTAAPAIPQVDASTLPHDYAAESCIGNKDSFLGKFCLDRTAHRVPYTRLNYPSYGLFVACFLVSALVIHKITKKLLSRKDTSDIASSRGNLHEQRLREPAPADQPERSDQLNPNIERQKKELRQTVNKVSLWAVMFSAVCYVWIATVRTETGISELLRILFALIVVPSILILEAVAMALIELEDKDLPEKVGNINTRRAYRIRQSYLVKPEAYLRAREWLLAFLTVILTVVVEFEKYYIPGLGVYEGILARTLFTVVLATIAVIWIAQAPGKGLGKDRPVRLLNFPFGPERMNVIIVWLVGLIADTCIDKPSDAVTYLLNGIVQGAEPQLGPGGPRLFAEVIKRYGTGITSRTDTILLNDDGSGELDIEETTYIGKGKTPSYLLRLASDKGFVEKPDVTERSALIVPMLGANVEEDQRKWIPELAYDSLLEADVNYKVNWKEGEQKALVTVELRDEDIQNDQAFVLKLKVHADLNPQSFCAPANLGPDGWTISLTKPCYNFKTTIRLKPETGAGRFKFVEFNVSQEEYGEVRPHAQETAHFRKEQEWDPKSKEPRTRNGVSEDGKTLIIKLDQGLPGLRYEVSWKMVDPEDHLTADSTTTTHDLLHFGSSEHFAKNISAESASQ